MSLLRLGYSSKKTQLKGESGKSSQELFKCSLIRMSESIRTGPMLSGCLTIK